MVQTLRFLTNVPGRLSIFKFFSDPRPPQNLLFTIVHTIVCRHVSQESHVKECDWLEVVCQNVGCNIQDVRKNIVQHQKTCQYRLVRCEYCRKFVQFQYIRVSGIY